MNSSGCAAHRSRRARSAMVASAEGGVMTLTRQADGNLRSDFPDITHFKRLP